MANFVEQHNILPLFFLKKETERAYPDDAEVQKRLRLAYILLCRGEKHTDEKPFSYLNDHLNGD
jgi:hypothetical protein